MEVEGGDVDGVRTIDDGEEEGRMRRLMLFYAKLERKRRHWNLWQGFYVDKKSHV